MKRVRAKWIIKLPATTKLNVRVGEFVGREDILAEAVENHHKIVDMSRELAQFPKEVVENLRQKLPLEVKLKDKLIEKTGFWGKQLVSPEEGWLIRIDEFNNFVFRQESDGVRIIKSPVVGKIVKGDKTCVAIEFGALQVRGKGRGIGKKWADGLVEVRAVSDIDYSLKNKLVVAEYFDEMMAVKAEVVGVAGVVVGGDTGFKTSLLVFEPRPDDFKTILGLENLGVKQVLLNSSDGRLMIVK